MRTNSNGRWMYRVRRSIPEIGAKPGDIVIRSALSFTVTRAMDPALAYVLQRDSDGLEPMRAPEDAPPRPALKLIR